MKVELDVGIARHEVGQMRRHMQSCERRRRRDLEVSARSRVAAADEVFRLRHEAQDVEHALEIALARFRERQLSRRPLKQARSNSLFQKADAL
jgi:hypothetical protein